MLGLMGRSLNVISLAGLAFAVGMLVDNAVVVLENIYRRRQSGESAFQAASEGTKEVAGAVIASTLTTIAVFIPVLFVQETSGQLFRDIALAISCAVGLSLIVSFTLIPTAAARLISRGPFTDNGDSPGTHPNGSGRDLDENDTLRSQYREAGPIVRLIYGFGVGLSDGVTNLNRWILASSLRSAALIVLMVTMSVWNLLFALAES